MLPRLLSPIGLMIVAGLFVVFIFPMMKVDPEEFKEFKNSMGGGGGGLLSGASGDDRAAIKDRPSTSSKKD